jgi:dihydroorotase
MHGASWWFQASSTFTFTLPVTRKGPPLTLRDGVTAWVDAGTVGADRIDDAVAVAKGAPNLGRLLINISRTGLMAFGEKDLNKTDVGLARGAIGRHRDFIVGVKARLSNHQVGDHDLEALRRAQEAAVPFNRPVMIHMGQSVSPMRAILPLLKRGDIVTHMMAPPPNAIVDDDGRLYPDVLAARRRGVLFDVANGRFDHIRWDVAERVIEQGFLPDTISTDWNTGSPKTGVIDFPNVMSKNKTLVWHPLEEEIEGETVKFYVEAEKIISHLPKLGIPMIMRKIEKGENKGDAKKWSYPGMEKVVQTMRKKD